MHIPGSKITAALLLLTILIAACSTPTPTTTQVVELTPARPAAGLSTNTPSLSPPTPLPPTITLPPVSTPASTPTPEPARFVEPAGCREPSRDMTRVTVNGFILNQRTLEMLQYAAELYGGKIDIANTALTQGSFSNNGPASFGTHLGGGAVDISVIRPNSYSVMYEEIIPLITALRTAGFAAWLRDWNELAEGSGIHIHAVAIGDPELSSEAIEQLTGPAGYFRGYAGFLRDDGIPAPDHDGSPIICQWMISAGYADLRPESMQIPQSPEPNWMLTLQETGKSFITTTHEESIAVAHSLRYLASGHEDPSLMCGPLAAALWQSAGLLPPGIGPWNDLHNYWLADPATDGKPWSLLVGSDYRLYQYETPLAEFDFGAWPLKPGDFLYTYAKENGFEHMFVVTEVDQTGRAFTVANQYRGEEIGYLIERSLLYDPNSPGEGIIYDEWQSRVLGRTGHDGFDVYRLNGLSQEPGSLFEAQIRPGDTIYSLAAKYYSTADAIITANPNVDITHLELDSWLWIPVNITGWDNPVIPVSIPVDSVEDALERHIQSLMDAFPSGTWHVYIEDLQSGLIVSLHAEESIHPASTIKLPIAIAMFSYIEHHADTKLTDGPTGSTRSFEQLLEAMLIQSEEVATAELENFLHSTRDANPLNLARSWGAIHTTFEPRRSTAADMGLLWKRLYLGELLTSESSQLLLTILRTPSRGDDQRIGAGLPDTIRMNLAHKTGTTFEMELGVVADTGVVETPQGAYVIVVIGNDIESIDYEAATGLIAEISKMVYTEING